MSGHAGQGERENEVYEKWLCFWLVFFCFTPSGISRSPHIGHCHVKDRISRTGPYSHVSDKSKHQSRRLGTNGYGEGPGERKGGK